jgi:hypothetical protein
MDRNNCFPEYFSEITIGYYVLTKKPASALGSLAGESL